MLTLALMYDMRSPDFGPPTSELYEAAVEQTAWADGLGFDVVYLGEHHGAEDGYLPSPIVLASALASRTEQIRLQFFTLLAPLYDPLRLAEDLAILDLLSKGRVSVLLGIGYRPTEYVMFGVEKKHRVALLEEAVRVLRLAWSGEPFEYAGRTVQILPRPYQRPAPRILIGGSAAPSARRAALIGDGYIPAVPALYATYQEELHRLGKPAAPPLPVTAPLFLHITEKPEADWPRLAPYLIHANNTYAKWAVERDGGMTKWRAAEGIGGLRADPRNLVVTPKECVRFAQSLPEGAEIRFRPLAGGLPPDLSWQSLHLFEREVLPELRRLGLRPRRTHESRHL
jgi:alkanesulfonate monooxygenase SsuD/methylene tetrahydromethanopterin reductase-like flavin-dependent oxidoreductase (luciferase family)